MQAGVTPIGASGGALFVSKWVAFDTPFTSGGAPQIPVVICTVSDRDGYDDSFNVTTRYVQNIGFEAIIRRQDQPVAWGANLELHWLAIQK